MIQKPIQRSRLRVLLCSFGQSLGDRAGLDPIAFRVEDRDELQRWAAHLEAKGVAQSGIADMSYGPTLVFRDPDNIQLELFVAPLAELAGPAIAEADLASSE